MTNTTALTQLSQRLALVTALFGGLVMLGWFGDQPSWLIHFLPSWVSMKFNTALGFVVAGVALLMRHRSQYIRVGYRIAAISLMLLGLLTLIEYGLAINLGIDQWLIHDRYALQTADAGRMPPISAVCFLLLGGIFYLDSAQLAHHKRLMSSLALSISVISGLYILGYAYHVESFSTNAHLTTMPLHTAILFFLLSFSALTLHPAHPLLSASAIPQAKNLFLMILVIPVVSWFRLEAQVRYGLYDANTGLAFMTLFFMVTWLIVVVRSMNTIHQQQQLIQKQHLLHQSILSNMSEGVIVVDPKHEFQVFNPAAEEMLGKGITSADAASLHELYGVFYPNSLQRYEVEDYPVIQALKGVCIDDEVQFIRNRIRPEGRYINVSARPISNEAGAIVGAVAVLHDISEIRRVSEALLKAANDERSLSQELNVLNNKLRIYSEEIAYKNQQLEHVSQMKSEFLANMSHELRTPLNAIIGFSEILKDGVVGELSKDQTSYVTEIFDSGEHLLSLINDILDLSKVEAGMMTLDISLVEVVNLLQSSLSVIKEKALKNSIKLTLDVENAPAHIMADGRKLKQIVYNLLSNAVKFTPEHGEIRLVAKIVGRDARQLCMPDMAMYPLPAPETDWQQFLEIRVYDTGIGIEADDLHHLFQAFSQIDSSLSRQFEGTGLGLELIRRMAELHGGSVAVASAPNKGSCFAVWLPIREDELAEELHEESAEMLAAPLSEPSEPTPSAHSNLLALIIEDNPQATQILQHNLEGAGFTVIVAPNATQAFAIMDKNLPDLITLDLFLPDLDGWELLALIKADPRFADIPVVIISIASDSCNCMALGAAKVLQKPLRREELISALRDLGLITGESPQFTVLAVDDDSHSLSYIEAYLTAEKNIKLLYASNGLEALTMIKHAVPDLLVLDLLMPVMNGFELVAQLRESPSTALLPIVVITSKEVSTEEHQWLSDHNVGQIIDKSPINGIRFLNEVRRALQK